MYSAVPNQFAIVTPDIESRVTMEIATRRPWKGVSGRPGDCAMYQWSARDSNLAVLRRDPPFSIPFCCDTAGPTRVEECTSWTIVYSLLSPSQTMEIQRLKPTVLATLALLSAACGNDPAGPQSPTQNGSPNGIVAGTLEVTATGGLVKLRNTTEHQLGYLALDKNQMVVALYPPCGTNCPVLVQGAIATIPYPQISGYTNQSTHAAVLWWRYTVRADGTRAAEGAVQTTLVQLK